MRKSLAEVREVTLITAARMSKERRLNLNKVNLVEVVVIHMVAVEVFFVVMAGPTVHHVVADIRLVFASYGLIRSRMTGLKEFIRARMIVL